MTRGNRRARVAAELTTEERDPPFADALSAMLPRSEVTLFLRACLQRGGALEEAWRAWCHRVDPISFLRRKECAVKRHLPLLYSQLVENRIPIASGLEPYLRTALVHERLRSQRFDLGLRQVAKAFRKAGVDFTLLKGVALAHTVYASPTLRHCHDVDVLVDADDRVAATEALSPPEFRLVADDTQTIRLVHDSGLPIAIHTTLLSNPVYSVPIAAILGRREEFEYQDERLALLSPPDMLVHVCAHASTASRRPTCNWVIDSFALLRQHPKLDWRRVVDVMLETGLALPMVVLFGYLANELEAPIPVHVRSRLRSETERCDDLQLAAAIDGAWRGRPGGLGSTLKRSGWPSRLRILRRVLEGGFATPPRRHGGAAASSPP